MVSRGKFMSYDLVKPFRALRFSPIFVFGAATGCSFFFLGAGLGLYNWTLPSRKWYRPIWRIFCFSWSGNRASYFSAFHTGDRASCLVTNSHQIFKFFICNSRKQSSDKWITIVLHIITIDFFLGAAIGQFASCCNKPEIGPLLLSGWLFNRLSLLSHIGQLTIHIIGCPIFKTKPGLP